MDRTDLLIDALAADLRPTRRLWPPAIRAGLFIAAALAGMMLLLSLTGIRSDWHFLMADPRFVGEVGGALVTGIAAAVAVFHLSLPDRSDRWAALPVPPSLVWLSSIGIGCAREAMYGANMGFYVSWQCMEYMTFISLPLGLLLAALLRHAGPIRPMSTAALGMLCVTALTSACMKGFHDPGASYLVLIWQIGTASLLIAFGALAAQVIARQSELRAIVRQ